MNFQELDPIIIQVTVPLPPPMIFEGWTRPDQLNEWMCDAARVDGRKGGAYELTWNGEPAFTSHGMLTHFEPAVELGFTWEAPPELSELMNRPELKTHVYVRLQDSPEGIDVTLEHSGWGSGPSWEEARSWHFQLWDDRLHRLRPYLMKVAYG